MSHRRAWKTTALRGYVYRGFNIVREKKEVIFVINQESRIVGLFFDEPDFDDAADWVDSLYAKSIANNVLHRKIDNCVYEDESIPSDVVKDMIDRGEKKWCGSQLGLRRIK